MHAQQLLSWAAVQGVTISRSEGHRLRLTPAEAVTDDLRKAVRAHRAQLLAHLRAANESIHSGLTTYQATTIRHWLDSIGETDEAIITKVLQMCSADPSALAYYLGRADEVQEPTVAQAEPEADPPPIVRCDTCKHFVPNHINPTGGLGDCAIDAPASAALCWPWRETRCADWRDAA